MLVNEVYSVAKSLSVRPSVCPLRYRTHLAKMLNKHIIEILPALHSPSF